MPGRNWRLVLMVLCFQVSSVHRSITCFAMCIRRVIVPPVLGGFVERHGLQHLMPHPVVAQRLHQFAMVQTFLS